MNKKNLAIASTVGVVAVMAMLFAYPAMAASTQTQPNMNAQQLLQHSQRAALQRADLKVGQTITITSVAGGYREVGNDAANGTASGSMTFQVTGALKSGYILTTSGGSISVNGTTYSVSAGSAELGPFGFRMAGEGQSGTTAQFLFSVLNLGKFGNTSYGVLRVDLSTGSSEWIARLLVTIA